MAEKHDCQIGHFYTMNPSIGHPVPRAVMARKQAHEEMLWHEGRIIALGHIRELSVRHMGVGVYEMTLVPLDEESS
jgi:hypothetical protein